MLVLQKIILAYTNTSNDCSSPHTQQMVID